MSAITPTHTGTPEDNFDSDLATAVRYLHHRNQSHIIDLLLTVRSFSLLHYNSDWGEDFYRVRCAVDVERLDDFDDESLRLLSEALEIATRSRRYVIDDAEVLPHVVHTDDWKDDYQKLTRGTPTNQATLVALADLHPIVDRMHFRDDAEVRVYQALKRAQERLPKHETISIAPNCAVRVAGATWEPDFVLVYKGRAVAIEVDGGSHRKKWASDRSRDDRLTDGGFQRVCRIDVADTESALDLDAFVETVLARLAT